MAFSIATYAGRRDHVAIIGQHALDDAQLARHNRSCAIGTTYWAAEFCSQNDGPCLKRLQYAR